MKKKPQTLFYLKIVHTIIFVFLILCIFYVLFSGIVNNHHWTVFIAIGILLMEGLMLLINRLKCPLTTLAEKKYGDKNGRVIDLFFPKDFLPYVMPLCFVLFFIGLILLIF